MVAFISLLLLATAGLSTVSALAIPKRNVGTDAVNIGGAIERLDNDIEAINSADPEGSTSNVQQGFSTLVEFLDSAAVSEQGQSELSDDDFSTFISLLDELYEMVSDLEAAVPTIQLIPDLVDVVESGTAQADSATSNYIDAIVALLSTNHEQAQALAEEKKISKKFQKVIKLLGSPSH